MTTIPDRRRTRSDLWRSLRETFVFPKRFPDPADEAAFRENHRRQFWRYRQAAILVGLLIWMAILPVELNQRVLNPAFYASDVWDRLLLVRLLVGCVLALGLALTFTSLSRRESPLTLLVLLMVSAMCGGQLVMTFFIVPYPLNYIYYFNSTYGILIALFTFVHVLSRPATALGLLILAMIGLCIALAPHPQREFDSAFIPFLPLLLVCHGVGVRFERYERERFVRERQLNGVIAKEQRARRLAAEERARADEQRDLLIQLKEEQRRLAERASADKSLFLAEAAHDLRQPMHALGNLLESACDAAAKDDLKRAAELIRMAQHAARLMRGSFNAVLEVSRLESGAIAPQYEEFDLLEVIDEVVGAVGPMAARREVDIRIRARGGVRLVVRSDRHLMSRVLTNLVSNGVKYCDPLKQARVVVGAVCLPTRVRVDVVDNGIGIPRKDWDLIFQPFRQLNNPQRDREKGLGLGLTIVSAIVGMLEEHRLDMRSAPGRGTRFSVDVPLRRIEPAIEPAAPSDADWTADLGSLYVLVVDDDALVRTSTATLLGRHGMLSETAASVDELARLLPSLDREPDALLTDYRLVDGRTALDVHAAVEAEFGRRLPCVIVTAEVGHLAGVDDDAVVLRKPVAPADLLKALARVRRTAATQASAV